MPAESSWRAGPPKWLFSGYLVLIVTVHLALAGFDVARWFDLFTEAWEFYAWGLAITSGTAAGLQISKKWAARGSGMMGGGYYDGGQWPQQGGGQDAGTEATTFPGIDPPAIPPRR